MKGAPGREIQQSIELPAAEEQLEVRGRRRRIADESRERMANVETGAAVIAQQIVTILRDDAAGSGKVIAGMTVS